MPEGKEISIFGVRLPVSGWAVPIFSVLAIVGAAALGWRQLSDSPDLVTLRQANRTLAVEVNEYNRHIFEPPELETMFFDDPRGQLAVRVYRDGCLIINRKSPAGTTTRLVPDLSRSDLDDRAVPRQSTLREFGVVHAQQPCGGRCWDPHQGQFTWAYGQRNGCFVEVWRRFADGCEHMQWLNTCTGGWDSNPDGSPRVRWTCCRH